VDFRILGNFNITTADGPLHLAGARRRGLLALLVTYTDRPWRLGELADALWNGTPSAAAERTVQSYVSRLRGTLLPDGPLIRQTSAGYFIDLDGHTLDATTFEQLANDAARARGDAPSELAALEVALRLWRGPALAEFRDQSWSDAPARRLDALHLLVVERRIDLLIEMDRVGEVLPELEQLVLAYPLHERFWGQLMLSRYHLGRTADALRAFQDARRALSDRAGVAPGPELVELERRILDHDVDALRRRRGSGRVHHTDLPARLRDEHEHTLWRAAERARVRDFVRGHELAGFAIVLVSAAPGPTATQFVAAVASDAADAGAVIGYARCESSDDKAYRPWQQVLDSLGPPITDDDLPDEIDPKSEPHDALDHLVTRLARVARNRPVVIVLEDIEHADRPSLDVTRAMLHTPTDLAITLVLTTSGEATGDHRALRDVQNAIRDVPSGLFVRLSMSGDDATASPA
jgi:DNA-binding SARP family transcriptional activator